MLPFTIQIPIFNETRALRFSAFFFDRIGVMPRYVLDTQSTPEARETAHSLALQPPFFTNDKPFIENGYQAFAEASPTDWILRLDCDEAISTKVLDACLEHVQSGRTETLGFDRHQVIWRDGQMLTATSEQFLPTRSTQWRLFNRRHVSFDQRIHTPGIILREPRPAPPGATIYHLSWIFLDMQARAEKAVRYDRHAPAGNSAKWLIPIEDIQWAQLDAPTLRDAFAEWQQLYATSTLENPRPALATATARSTLE